MDAANARTRVTALLLDTGQGWGTLWIDGTLRFALNVWIAKKTRQACTRGSTIAFSAFSIDATR